MKLATPVRISTFILFLLFTFCHLCRSNTVDDYDSLINNGTHKVYRIYPNTSEQLDFLNQLKRYASDLQLNFWKYPSRIGVASDVMVHPKAQNAFEKLLNMNNIGYMVTIEDVKRLIIERENSKDKWDNHIMADIPLRTRTSTYFNFQQYHGYNEIKAFLDSLEKAHSNIAKVFTIGYTHEKRPIQMIKIGFPVNSNSKKAIWIDAGIHAREWAAHSTAMYFINELVTKYDSDPLITQYVRNLTWYITPVVNPDGYEFSRSSQEPDVRMWRKNRSPNSDTCKRKGYCCMGVDLNRNFDFHWGESGASSNPCDEDYEGPYVFSEPESRAVRDFVLAHQNEIDAFITFHTYSQLWLHPFGHKKNNYPSDISDLKATATLATAALKNLYGTSYTVGSGADTLYVASGGSDDWAKSKANIKYVYLVELRPSELVWDGFILPVSQIIPTGKETWEGVKVVVNKVLTNHGFKIVRS